MWEKLLIFTIIFITSVTSFWLGRYRIEAVSSVDDDKVLIQMERFISVLQENQRKIGELQEDIYRLQMK